MTRILVLGGYGVFGSRAVERLARASQTPGGNFEIVIAGRNLAAARTEAARLAHSSPVRIEPATLDARTLTDNQLGDLGVTILLNTAGPFQGQDYHVARAAIAAGAHYVDLADARDFVTGIGVLDAEARAADVLVVSGASSVPALACAVIEHLALSMNQPESLVYGISPGNSFDPGLATVEAILGAIGRPFETLIDCRRQVVHGWQPLHRESLAGLGTRWFGACDVPDLDLFPARFPTVRTQRFVAGVEVKMFHAALWGLSWMVRGGLVQHPERMARFLLSAKRHLARFGSDRGGMFVRLKGRGNDGGEHVRRWDLVAGCGHGPYIPAIPAVIIARRLARGQLDRRGAMPALGLMTLDDFSAEVADLDIRQHIT